VVYTLLYIGACSQLVSIALGVCRLTPSTDVLNNSHAPQMTTINMHELLQSSIAYFAWRVVKTVSIIVWNIPVLQNRFLTRRNKKYLNH
jgi:hypothetical protein